MRTAVTKPCAPTWEDEPGSELLGRAAHELRSPLTLIYGYLETLQSNVIKGSTSIQKSLSVMDKHARRMLRILDDLSVFGSLHEEVNLPRDQRFSLRHCLDDVLEQLTPLLELRQPTMDITVPDAGEIIGSRVCWDLVLNNLIERAVFGNDDKPVTITISGEWTPTQFRLVVSDNGPAIPAAELPYVFQPFRCRCPGALRDAGCTGLSLAIVAKAVSCHGGAISVVSTQAPRTDFIITVPISRESAARHESRISRRLATPSRDCSGGTAQSRCATPPQPAP